MSLSTRSLTAAACLLSAATLSPGASFGASATLPTAAIEASVVVHYRTANVAGVDIFYREAGPQSPSTIMPGFDKAFAPSA